MPLFEPYAPGAHGVLAAGLSVRPAADADISAIGALWHSRHGGDLPEALAGIRRHFAAIADGQAPDHVFVATIGGEVVAFARCGHRSHASTGAADGWYLIGLNVSAAHRRCGIGRALGETRFRWLRAQGAAEVYSFTTAANPASLALHRALGFTEVTRAFSIPRVSFTGGVGILLRRSL